MKLNPGFIKFLEVYQEQWGSIPISIYKSCVETQKQLEVLREDNKNTNI
jgi:hypothetical protein